MKIKLNMLKTLILIVIISLSGCDDDFLERSIKIRYTYDDIIKYPGLLQGNGMAAYKYLRQWNGYGSNAFLAAGCDEADFANKGAAIQRFNTGGWNQFSNPDEVMGWYYRGIRQTFEFLNNSENFREYLVVDTITLTTKTDYLRSCDNMFKLRAENRFLRAWFYFELIKRYGGVPILQGTLDLEETNMPPRNTFDECVQYILDELDIAYPDIVDHWFNYDIPDGVMSEIGSGKGSVPGSSDNTNLGRVEKPAVKAFRLRVLLYAASPLFNPNGDISKWQAAAAAGQDFLTDPALAPWRHLYNNYEQLFNGKAANVLTSRFGTNSGVIFTIPSNNGYNNSNFERWNYPVGIQNGGNKLTTPSQNLVDAFEMQATGLPVTDLINSGYDPNNPYAGRDPRLKMIVGVNGEIYGKNIGGANRPIQSYIGGADGIGVKQGATTTGYYLKKMCQPDMDLSTNPSAIKAFPVLRYAEVLLNFAEAMNEAYGPDEKPSINGQPAFYSAREAINLVRSRNGVAMPPIPPGLSQDEFRTRLRNERRVELAFEEHRFFDVRRWKIAEVTENLPLLGMRVIPVNPPQNTSFSYEKFTVENRIFDAPKMYLYPIPEIQINVNGWQQNPGW